MFSLLYKNFSYILYHLSIHKSMFAHTIFVMIIDYDKCEGYNKNGKNKNGTSRMPSPTNGKSKFEKELLFG